MPLFVGASESYDTDAWEAYNLKKENAKLRELVQELYKGHVDSPCEDCPLKGKPACADCLIFAREVAVIDRVCELEEEVD